MYKKIVPIGSKLSFSDIISDVQDFSHQNAFRKIQWLTEQYGVLTTTSSGVAVGPELKPNYAHPSGVDLNTWGNVIFENSAYTLNFGGAGLLVYDLDTIGANAGYQIVVNYNTTLTESADMTNGFLYPDGSAYTKQNPAYYLKALPIASTPSDLQIRIASGITDGSSLMTGVNFWDARVPYKLKSNILDETYVVLKDRINKLNYSFVANSGLVSHGYTAIHGETVHTDNVTVSGTLTATGNLVIDNGTTTLGIGGNNYLEVDSPGPLTTYHAKTPGGIEPVALISNTDNTIPVFDSSNTFLGNVLLTGESPTVPQNFRLYDINPDRYVGKESAVSFKWNYDDILLSGTVTGATEIKTNPDQSYKWDTKDIGGGSWTRYQTITSGSLAGKYLRNSQNTNQQRYKILGNTAEAGPVNGITLVLQSGLTLTDASISTVNFASQPPWFIEDDADGYWLTIERVPSSLNEFSSFGNNLAAYKNTHVLPREYVNNPQFTIHLPTDATYTARIEAIKNMEHSQQIYLNQDYNNAPIYYSKEQLFDGTDDAAISPNNTSGNRRNFKNDIPVLGAGTATVKATPFGFTVSITGWYDTTNPDNNPHEFEIIYTEGSKPTDWNDITGTSDDTAYTRMITQSRRISVNTVEHKQYHIAVWPILNKTRVSSAVELSVIGGAGGIFPEHRKIATVQGQFLTATVSGIYNDVIQTTYQSPALSGVLGGSWINYANTQSLWNNTMIAKDFIVRDDDQSEFAIERKTWYNWPTNDQLELTLTKISGASNTISGVCHINTTKNGKIIHKEELPIDTQLYSAYFLPTYCEGVSTDNPGIIRIYQEGNEDAADYITVTSENLGITDGRYVGQNISLNGTVQGRISGSEFTRTLVVDLWDPNGLNNFWNFAGSIQIYAQPLIQDRTGDRPIPNISV